jgi:hypothetical protein
MKPIEKPPMRIPKLKSLPVGRIMRAPLPTTLPARHGAGYHRYFRLHDVTYKQRRHRSYYRMKLLKALAMMMLLLSSSGCASFWPWEPYPRWQVEVIHKRDVPEKVAASFRWDFPNTKPVRIEKSVFMSRIQGYPALYRFWVSESVSRIYDGKGVQSHQTAWFGESGPKP